METTNCRQALGSLQVWLDSFKPATHLSSRTRAAESIPVTSQARQQQSLTDSPAPLLDESTTAEDGGDDETVLYLGYGSNLCAETFQGKRGIQPISQVNVVVPSLSLTFDLPGIPYAEPCFGNVRYRDESLTQAEHYHKDNWSKGLVGVVYEVTKKDYIHIIATEGGGSGYLDVQVDCYALSGEPSQDVPEKPTEQPFKAHTLFAPSRLTRPTHSYAQPSPRYLKLITDGANEHGLPVEYQAYLQQVRTFHITSTRQRLGSFVFLSVWAPLFLLFTGGVAAIFLKPDGTYPEWFAKLLNTMFASCWASYDKFFKRTFGEGERTIGDVEDVGHDGDEALRDDSMLDEKQPLIERQWDKYGAVTTVEEIV